MTDFAIPAVAAAYDAIPQPERQRLLTIEEPTKSGQPTYLTSETKSGTTVRLGQLKHGNAAVLPEAEDIGATTPPASFIHSALVYHKR